MPPKNNSEEVMEQDKPEVVHEGEVLTNEVNSGEPQTTGAVVPHEGELQSVATDGIRARRGLTMKSLIPNPAWINQNIVAKERGHRETVGRVFGFATGIERKVNEHQGRMLESIAVRGLIQYESYVTGELGEASSVFLPMAYAEKIAALFQADPTIKAVEIDCDIGLEATGKTIPYEWVVTAFREGKEMLVMNRLRNSRARPENASRLLTANEQKAISDQSN